MPTMAHRNVVSAAALMVTLESGCADDVTIAGDGTSESETGGPGDGDGDPGNGEDFCEPAPTNGPSRCGDGLVGLGEQCDDGNLADADGCSNACQTAHAELVDISWAGQLAISLEPGQLPEQTRITLLDPAFGAYVYSLADDGSPLGMSDPSGDWATTLRTLPDGTSVVVGVEYVDGDTVVPWTAHLDGQGTLQSLASYPGHGTATRDLLVRDDGSAVICGATDLGMNLGFENPGVWAIDAKETLLWTSHPFGEGSTNHAPGGVAELADGTVVAMHRIQLSNELDVLVTRGFGLTGLDPATGEPLWASEIVCDEQWLDTQTSAFAGLSNDTLLLATSRMFDTELLVFDATGAMIARERWPEFDTNDEPKVILADAEGGAFVIGTLANGPGDTYVAYWHAEHTRRFVLTVDVPGASLRDAALEPGERLWLLDEQGVIAIGL
jgi:cysteine-rich repeat protein